MEKLKLTSIRVSVNALDSAHSLAKELGYYNPSDVLRLAMWVGLKVITPRCATKLMGDMWKEEADLDIITLEHVLRTAGVLKEDEQGTGL